MNFRKPALPFLLALLAGAWPKGPAHAEEAAPQAPAQPAEPAPAAVEVSQAPPEASAPRIDVSVPAPAKEVQRSYKMHDGFYLRPSLGFGSLSVAFDDGGPSSKDWQGSGFALNLDVLVGGSPSVGLALGGGLIVSSAFSASFEREAQDVDRNATLSLLGVFVDGFPDPSGGFHVGGLFGLASVVVEKQPTDPGKNQMGGFGGAAWIGHDFWVADEWSTGLELRFAGALASNKSGSVETSAAAFSTALLFTALYH